MRAVDRIAQEMKARGLCLFTFPGGTLAHLYDACHKAGVEVVVGRSELGAGFMAIGAAKVTGKPQVCAVTSGPGATNVLTCVADAYYDSVPVVFLTGQVSSKNLIDRGGVRQRGFQETPILEMAYPITLTDYDEPGWFLAALKEVVDTRPGPVLIDMLMDMQVSEWNPWPHSSLRLPYDADIPDFSGHKPLILAGMGAMGAWQEIRTYSERWNIPVVTSLPAVGLMPTRDSRYLGYIGHTGHPGANRAIQECDALLVLGARLDVRQTGTEADKFASRARIVRVDIDHAELEESRVSGAVNVYADCREFMREMLRSSIIEHETWWTREAMPGSQMGGVITHISETAPEECIFVTGVGTHQQEAARHLYLDYPKRQFLTSAGHGCMGAGLPMAIGASIATGKKAVLIDGDGSFQITMNELGTLKATGAQVDIHVMDNGAGGLVSQFARLQGYDPAETTWDNPDFEQIARAYGLDLTVWEVEQEGVWPIVEGGHELTDATYV